MTGKIPLWWRFLLWGKGPSFLGQSIMWEQGKKAFCASAHCSSSSSSTGSARNTRKAPTPALLGLATVVAKTTKGHTVRLEKKNIFEVTKIVVKSGLSGWLLKKPKGSKWVPFWALHPRTILKTKMVGWKMKNLLRSMAPFLMPSVGKNCLQLTMDIMETTTKAPKKRSLIGKKLNFSKFSTKWIHLLKFSLQ